MFETETNENLCTTVFISEFQAFISKNVGGEDVLQIPIFNGFLLNVTFSNILT